jgi:sigma54-dependent transcription regulator
MKALTIWQPWASLIMLGHKPYEFRGWAAPASIVGQRIAIHSGKRKVKVDELDDLITRLRGPNAWSTGLRPAALDVLMQARERIDILPLSHVLCTAVVGKSVQSYEIAAEFGASVNDSDRHEHANWAWPMLDVQRMAPPIEARGAQGLWNWGGV